MAELCEVIAWKYDHAPGIRTREKRDADGNGTGVMEIFDWPKNTLGPQPTPEQIAQWSIEYDSHPKSPDPDVELDAAIAGATTLQELKDALLGRVRAGKVAGRLL